jgi:biotin/methionine sulfoxide reductase
MRINPADALMRCIKDDDLVKVYNDRGAFLAAAHVTRDLRPGVIQVSTGAWYDPVASPDEPGAICVNGNPNAVTQDIGTSQLAQGCTGQLCLVQVKRFEGVPPSGRGYKPPRLYLGDLKERPRDPR